MDDGRYNTGIHLKLVLLCFLFAVAALAEEITPSFSVAPNKTYGQDAMRYELTWENDDIQISFSAICTKSSRAMSLIPTDIVVSDESRREPYQAVCRLGFMGPLFGRLKLSGLDASSLKNFDEHGKALKKIHHELMKGRSLPASVEKPFNVLSNERRNERTNFVLKPSEEYIIAINNLNELVAEKNIEAAASAIELIKRNAARAEERRIRERNSAIALTVLSGFGLVMLYVIYRSGIIQRGFRASSDRAASAIESGKHKIREKKRLSAAKELVVWSELREKGHITEEEFAKKKRELMG